MCESFQCEIQCKFSDEMFTKRTASSHKTYVDEINNSRNSKTKHYKGVKNQNCLAPLEYYHVIDGLPPDLMYDFQEDLDLYSIAKLNEDLKTFK